jgi:hypothetical protein
MWAWSAMWRMGTRINAPMIISPCLRIKVLLLLTVLLVKAAPAQINAAFIDADR